MGFDQRTSVFDQLRGSAARIRHALGLCLSYEFVEVRRQSGSQR
jgi:hypothetical protein